VYRKTCGRIWALRDNLNTNFSWEWLGALLAAALPEIYTGIKTPPNPAACDCQILGANALKTGNWTDLVNDRLRPEAVTITDAKRLPRTAESCRSAPEVSAAADRQLCAHFDA
jgi:hypothetical protein